MTSTDLMLFGKIDIENSFGTLYFGISLVLHFAIIFLLIPIFVISASYYMHKILVGDTDL